MIIDNLNFFSKEIPTILIVAAAFCGAGDGDTHCRFWRAVAMINLGVGGGV